jgi:FAD/FMN-containing dehydrogenase
MPSQTELTLFVAPAPPQFADHCKSGNGFVVIVSAVAFVDSPGEAAAILGKLETVLPDQGCLNKQTGESMTMDGLLDLGGSLWPEHHRYLADTLWSNVPAAQPLEVLRAQFLRAPSSKSVAVYVVPAGTGGVPPDVAFSMRANALLLSYAVWERAEEDAANAAWHSQTIAALDQFAVGHYVGESDIITSPLRAERSYAPANWARLKSLREKYDPGSLFLNHFR